MTLYKDSEFTLIPNSEEYLMSFIFPYLLMKL